MSSYIKLKKPFYELLDSCEEPNLIENVLGELQAKAKTAIDRICDESNELLDNYWVKRDDSNEAVADYRSFLATQYAIKSRYGSQEDKQNKMNKAFHEEALKIANEHLNPAHPIRLNVAVNYSLFCYNKLDSVDKALAVAEEAHEKGLSCLPKISDEIKLDSEERLESLKEYIDKWS